MPGSSIPFVYYPQESEKGAEKALSDEHRRVVRDFSPDEPKKKNMGLDFLVVRVSHFHDTTL